jgi:hypothetical protein
MYAHIISLGVIWTKLMRHYMVNFDLCTIALSKYSTFGEAFVLPGLER